MSLSVNEFRLNSLERFNLFYTMQLASNPSGRVLSTNIKVWKYHPLKKKLCLCREGHYSSNRGML